MKPMWLLRPAFMVAVSPESKALAASRQPSGRTGQIEGRMLCLFGGKDAHIPMSDVDTVRGALESKRYSA